MDPRQTYAGPTPTPPAGPLNSDDTLWAVISHLGGLLGSAVLFGHILVPLLILILKGPTSAFVRDHSREALNFQITMSIYYIVTGILAFITFGLLAPFFAVLGIFELVVVIMAAVKAGAGEYYRYPATFRFVR